MAEKGIDIAPGGGGDPDLQTLGANHPRYNHLRKHAATAIAVVITGANLTFPLSVMLGFLQPTTMTFPAW